MEWSYELQGDKKYLVLSDIVKEKVCDYQYKMLKVNRHPSLIPCDMIEGDYHCQFFYDVTHVIPLKDYLKDKQLTKLEYQKLLGGILYTLSTVIEYLLSDKRIELNTTRVFIDKKEGKPYLLYLPILEEQDSIKDLHQLSLEVNNCPLEDSLISLSQRFEQALTYESNYGKLAYILEEKDRWKRQKKIVVPDEEVSTKEIVADQSKKKKKVILAQIIFIFVMVIATSLLKDFFFNKFVLGILAYIFLMGEIAIFVMYKKATAVHKKSDSFTLNTQVTKSYGKGSKGRLKGRLYKENGMYFMVFESPKKSA